MVTLAIVARALRPKAKVIALIGRPEKAHILMPYCHAIYPSAKLRLIDETRMRAALLDGQQGRLATRWTNWLAMTGFFDPEILRTRFAWWHETFLRMRPALIVAEFAPTALLAARALGIPSCATGNSFGLPPAHMPRFAPLVAEGETDGIEFDDTRLLSAVNRVVGPYALPELMALPEIYRSDIALPTGISEWDPYAPWRQEALLPPVAEIPPLADGSGEEVFIYFSVDELEEPANLEAIAALDIPARLYAPQMSEAQRARLASNPALTIESAPVPQREIVARTRVLVCAGQAGTLGLGVLAGLPVLNLPRQSEQRFNAMRAARFPSCRCLARPERSRESILAAIADFWSDPGIGASARATAQTLRSRYTEDTLQSFRRILGPRLTRQRDTFASGSH